MKLRFYLGYALRSLRRGGQRSLLALICIAFGVLSLCAMQLLAGSLRSAIVLPPAHALGGDFALRRDSSLDALALAQLEEWRQRGVVQQVAVVQELPQLLVRGRGGERVHFLSRALGVPATYPLLGELELASPAAADPHALLRQPGNALLTQDVARALSLGPGDTVRVASMAAGGFAALRVAGIIRRMPDHRGETMLLGAATASALGGAPTLALLAAADSAVVPLARAAGWDVRTPQHERAERARVVDLFDLMLKGAGLLGLLVGALGVANTLQVLLARRGTELAVLKTLGYRERDLLLLLALECTMLGIAGSALGALGGIGVAAALVRLLDQLQGNLSVVLEVAWPLVRGSFVIGIVMALCFGAFAALRASTVRPAVLLRGAAPAVAPGRGRAAALLVLLLLAAFTTISALVLGDVLRALALVLITTLAAGLIALLLWLALLAATRLPLPLPPLARLAQRGVARRPLRAVIALGALATGVFTIAFAATALLSGRTQLLQRQVADSNPGVLVSASADAAGSTEAALRAGGHALTREPGPAGGARWRIATPNRAPAVLADSIARALPAAIVVASSDVSALYSRAISGLFNFVLALASLALAAGAVLIANAVGLGLLERRQELAVFKAVGYSSAQVLRLVLFENALLGALGAAFGLAGARLAVGLSNLRLPQAKLALSPGAALALLALGTLLSMAVAAIVAWGPVRVRPGLVLRQEG